MLETGRLIAYNHLREATILVLGVHLFKALGTATVSGNR